MAFKKPQINKIKTTMESLQIYMRAEKKFGKSTLFRDVILEKFGDAESGLLIGIGDECGYSLLDELNATQVESAEEFIELINWLIKEKGKEHNIKMVAVDVVDELFPMFESYVCKLSVRETGKPCKSVNGAFGGYGEGQKRLALEMKKIFTKLKKAGIGTFAIAHTKTKNIKKKEDDGDGYMIISSTLQNNYEAVFGDIFDVVMTGIIDREIADGKVVNSSRYLYFRGDGYVDAGSRFADGTIPDKILFDKPNMSKELIDIIETAMKNSATKSISDEEFKNKQDAEKEEMSKIKEEIQEEVSTPEDKKDEIDPDKNKAIFAEIKPLYKNADADKKAKIKEILSSFGFNKFDLNAPTGMFEKVLKILS